MIDFSKKISHGKIEKRIVPEEIYENLDRKTETGPLRPSQKMILSKWYSEYQNKQNAIIKLHTGEGKTLIGLLLLLSKMNQGKGPSLYICPNIYLVDQTRSEAEKFGIPFCTFNGTDIPDEFLSSQRILITHVQKVFNGYSIFGLKNRSKNIGAIVMDDSHACIDSIQSSFTISISKEQQLYTDILSLFEDDLREQGEGTFFDIKNNEYNSFLPIPYWSWIDKSSELVEMISKYSNEDFIKFVWPLIKDDIKKCQGYISGNRIEVSPIYIPMEYFGTFFNAKHRVLMSATTQDDAFFIKGLGFSIDDVKNPLTNNDLKWSGEKLLIVPSLISDDLDRDLLITKFSKNKEKQFGIVSLITSFKLASQYENQGAIIAKSETIYKLVDNLKKGNYSKTIVFVNRYDGIDLPDNSCRILIIDSKPFLDSLQDRYEENCRPTSDIINTQIAQKIEQGLGRSVRGEKDYSAVIILGSELVSFIKSPLTKQYFSPQMQQQIAIGLKVAEFAKEEVQEDQNDMIIIDNLVKQVINRDEGWKVYYISEMNKLIETNTKREIYSILQKEHDVYSKVFTDKFDEAIDIMQTICDSLGSDPNEKGWYLQKLAHFKYFVSKSESIVIQTSAFNNNYQVLKPKIGITYKKLIFKNESRARKINQYITSFCNFDVLLLNIDKVLSNISFGVEAEKFEDAIKELGTLLGYESQRPDREIRKGPDNLWCIENNSYLMIECKSEVLDDRKSISKYEAGQFNNHCGWFAEEYKNAEVLCLMIIPTKNLSYHANFTHDVKIVRKSKLRLLRKNIKDFINEFKYYNLNEITLEKIDECLGIHNLDNKSLKTLYFEEYYHNKNLQDG
jgi:replicative superfamily II helicase